MKKLFLQAFSSLFSVLQTTRRNDGFRRFKIIICIKEAKSKSKCFRKDNSSNIKQDTVNLVRKLMPKLSPFLRFRN